MGKIYLVTGGAGFLGTAVLRMLADESADVDQVKVVDISIPNEVKEVVETGKEKGPTYEWIACDITDRSQIFAATGGCDIVIHVASVIPGCPKDDRDTMWNVNVTGARNVVDACKALNVKGLVYISTVSTVGPNRRRDLAENLDEDSEYDPHPRSFYGETKKVAEDYVLAANGHVHLDGTKLVTCSLRPALIYGQSFGRLRLTYHFYHRWKKILAHVPLEAKQSFIYVGNAAHAAITAGKQIEAKADLVGGEAYFLTDDTPPYDVCGINAELFSLVGFSLSRQPFVPFLLWFLLYTFLYWLARISKKLGISKSTLPEPDILWRTNAKFIVSNEKFVKHFEFQPRYSHDHAVKKVQEYVHRLAKTGFDRPIYDFEY